MSKLDLLIAMALVTTLPAWADCEPATTGAVKIPAGKRVTISTARDRSEASRVAMSVEIDGHFASDGTLEPHQSDGSEFELFKPRHPEAFDPETGISKNYGADMHWSNGDGSGFVHGPDHITRCYEVNTTVINFYTGAHDPYPNTIVKFEY